MESAPASKHWHWFGKELTEPANLSDYDVNACGYYRLPANTYAAIDMGEPEVTPAESGDACCNFRCDVCADCRGDSLL